MNRHPCRSNHGVAAPKSPGNKKMEKKTETPNKAEGRAKADPVLRHPNKISGGVSNANTADPTNSLN
jgi:hypothetical protein